MGAELRATVSPDSGAVFKSGFGFVVGFLLGFVVCAVVVITAILGTVYFMPGRFSGADYVMFRNIMFGASVGAGIGAGSWTAQAFRKIDFRVAATLERLTFGPSARMTVATYISWSLGWVTYVFLGKSDPEQWYDENSLRFWLALVVPPTVIVAAISFFNWANQPTASREETKRSSGEEFARGVPPDTEPSSFSEADYERSVIIQSDECIDKIAESWLHYNQVLKFKPEVTLCQIIESFASPMKEFVRTSYPLLYIAGPGHFWMMIFRGIQITASPSLDAVNRAIEELSAKIRRSS